MTSANNLLYDAPFPSLMRLHSTRMLNGCGVFYSEPFAQLWQNLDYLQSSGRMLWTMLLLSTIPYQV